MVIYFNFFYICYQSYFVACRELQKYFWHICHAIAYNLVGFTENWNKIDAKCNFIQNKIIKYCKLLFKTLLKLSALEIL